MDQAEQTFLFADLAGFTALTEAHGDERATDLIGDFVDRTRSVLGSYEATEVKAMGDALMLRASDAAQGVLLARRLATGIGGRHGFPAIRVGVHTGSAVERGGDWFGATVNLASRVSAAAAAGEVLVTEATRLAALGRLQKADFRYVGHRRFKNIQDRVTIYEALPGTASASGVKRRVIDPVCRMAVDPDRANFHRHHHGSEYHFCSSACALVFDQHPERHRR